MRDVSSARHRQVGAMYPDQDLNRDSPLEVLKASAREIYCAVARRSHM